MKIRSIIVVILFLITGTLIAIRPTERPSQVNEKFMEDFFPSSLGTFRMQASAENPKQTYKADDNTYKLLHPLGIVSRVFVSGREAYDVVIVAGNESENFHNPLQCFDAQDWKVGTVVETPVLTKTRGTVPMTVAHATKGGRESIAVYTYDGPRGMRAMTTTLYKDMFISEVLSAKPHIGTFYRFVTVSPNESEADVLRFAADYLDASKSLKDY